jgi:hypothetical protein
MFKNKKHSLNFVTSNFKKSKKIVKIKFKKIQGHPKEPQSLSTSLKPSRKKAEYFKPHLP